VFSRSVDKSFGQVIRLHARDATQLRIVASLRFRVVLLCSDTYSVDSVETKGPLFLSKSKSSLESRTPSWSLTMNHGSVNEA